METQIYFTMQKKNIKKNPLKETKILKRYYITSITNNVKFEHKPNLSSFKKNSYIKIDLLLPRGL
jgi:hypothetical protein